jgi:non-heme chloroperoxidase
MLGVTWEYIISNKPRLPTEEHEEVGFNVAVGSSRHATYACVDTWLTDFRADLPKIDVPVLVLHGTARRIAFFHSRRLRQDFRR